MDRIEGIGGTTYTWTAVVYGIDPASYAWWYKPSDYIGDYIPLPSHTSSMSMVMPSRSSMFIKLRVITLDQQTLYDYHSVHNPDDPRPVLLKSLGTEETINEVEVPSYFNIFPNPSKGQFNIVTETQNDYKYSVYNLTGEVIYNNIESANQINIDLSNYPDGIYFLKIESKNNTFTEKLIKN